MSLKHRLLDRITGSGPIPFEEFMEAALYDPEGGFFSAAGVTVQGTLTVFVEKGLPFTGFEMPALAIGALIMILGGSLTLRRVGWR